MRARNGTWVLGCFGVVTATGLGACSFPNVLFEENVGPTSASSAANGPGSGGGTSGAQSVSSAGGDGGGGTGGEAGGSTTSSGSGGAAGAGGCPDADGDGQTSADCGGEDCADGDDRAFKGQIEYFVTPVKGLPDGSILQFDFDCNGGEEGRYTSSECKPEACDASSHFLVPAVVKCGEPAEFGTCVYQVFTCPKNVEFVKKVQECR